MAACYNGLFSTHMFVPLNLVWERVETARSDSPIAVCRNLMLYGEALLKTVAAGMIAAVADDKDRHRYRLCHKLIRSNGLGDWDDALANVCSGPALQHLRAGAYEVQQEITSRHGRGSYIYDATVLLQKCLDVIVPEAEKLPSRFEGRLWFSKFVMLRNKERAHGATPDDALRNIVSDLEGSLRLLADNSKMLKRPWVFLRRNLSGKYNVVPLGDDSTSFSRLKGDRAINLKDGVYVDFTDHCYVELIESTVDVIDFQYPNGSFRGIKSEWISYVSGTRRAVDATPYLQPASALPSSETQGFRDLRVVGGCLVNLPPKPTDYIHRDELESELTAVLMNDRHPIVTLVGRGGIGKTSLGLEVLYQITESGHTQREGRFLFIVWLSARDIDLLPSGPKIVRPTVVSVSDIAKEVSNLLSPYGIDVSNESAVAQLMRSCSEGPILFVFDNFETVQQPIDVYHWIDSNVRCPNKVLITTRHNDFRGDYEVEVPSMDERQCNALVDATAASIGMRPAVNKEFRQSVYRESDGHPYVVKVLVGEAADESSFRRVDRIVASRDDILDALFERTYARLSPAARRIFLCLGSWRSLVPIVAIEAALLRPSNEERIDVRAATEELRRVSFIDIDTAALDNSVFVSVPIAAAEFCKKKSLTAHNRLEIIEDIKFLHRFGAMQPGDLKRGLEPRIKRLFGVISEELQKRTTTLSNEIPILEMIARQYAPTWLLIVELIEESGGDRTGDEVLNVLTRYLESGPSAQEQQKTWERISQVHRRRRDWAGYLNAVLQIAEMPASDMLTVSDAANTINSLKSEVDITQRKAFAHRLISVMESRLGEADATDCSRLGWLLLQVGNEKRAYEVAQAGLNHEPENEFCINLAKKLERR
ncbi:MAG TPA: NB-ARC domain-containing protein [Bryobacteraceae bacterium]|jgi:hypothetical protein|nr:NB-ARC domain-containing protein [Bryobacteraceae bacterium]